MGSPGVVEWDLVLESPVFWGAMMTLVGALAGYLVTARSKQDEHELAGLKESVTALREDYNRVRDEVQELRTKVQILQSGKDKADKARRRIEEKYSVALAMLGSLKAGYAVTKVRAEESNFDLPGFPTLPESIRMDFEQIQPDPT